jgi:hypothetical protein
VSGHPVVTELVAYKPASQATRTSMKDMVVRWFTIEPVLTDSLQTSISVSPVIGDTLASKNGGRCQCKIPTTTASSAIECAQRISLIL